jgi:pimeloyl-ACP methyl ester carboxylesterase
MSSGPGDNSLIGEPFERRPVILRFRDTASFTETYGFSGSQGFTILEGQLLKLPRAEQSTLYIFMHPTSTLNLLPIPEAMARAGFHVLCAASRYPKNDAALIMEKAAVDMGAWVDWARNDGGYRKVILVGWSGGGALSLFYQAQAEAPNVTHTPAGDPVDLTRAGLQPADGLILVAAHLSRAETLTEWLDPSVMNETDPARRNPELDIYSEACPNKPPFSADFLAHFRDEQRRRSRGITDWCMDILQTLKSEGGAEVERGFVVHRTMCDPRWIDPLVDPNDRRPNWCYLGDPKTVNVGPVGLARFSTLRSWLSQWSFDFSNAKGPPNAERIRQAPVLQIENTADDAVPAPHARRVFDRLSTLDKQIVQIKNATHYYLGQPEHLAHCLEIIRGWSEKHGFETRSENVF